MADDRSDKLAGTPDKAPSPASLPERARKMAEELARPVKGMVSGGRDAKPADHEASPHTPDASGESGDSGGQSRGKSLSDIPKTFWERVEELRQRMAGSDRDMPGREEDMWLER